MEEGRVDVGVDSKSKAVEVGGVFALINVKSDVFVEGDMGSLEDLSIFVNTLCK